MRFYFKDHDNKTRCVEGEIPYAIEDQVRVRTYVNAMSDINLKLPVLVVLEGGKEE